MDEPRSITSLGRTRWSDAPAATIDARLGAVLLDNITSRLAVIDPGQRYLYANREMLDFLGWSAEDLVGRRVSEVIGETAYAGYLPIVERVWSGETIRIEGWVEFPSRGRRFMSETFVPYGHAEGDIELVAVFGRDHTELKMREVELADGLAQLHRSEALKSAIFDHAFAALVSTDAQGRIVEFNPAAAAMFGRTRAEVLGRPVSEVMIPERFRPAHEAGMRRMQGGGEGRVMGKRLEMHALRADGSEFPMEMVLWRTAAGGAVFYTASIADVSERHDAARQIERQREALRQSEKLSAMGSLLAGVAHELNNPLAIVMGRASLLEEKCDDHPALKADAARIREAAERCGRIVRTFLDMARNRPSRRGPVSLNEMARAAAEMLLYGYQTHDIALDLALAEGLPAVQADADQIGQVVMNLLVNAQQALSGTDGERRVRVETGFRAAAAGSGAAVWLRVHDNGPGVPGAARSRLFEPFFTTKAEGAGTGLGLAVSRSLARDHGGDVELETPAEGAGASFLFSLPVVAAEAAGVAPPNSSEPGAAPQARLLVVDDEADLAALMRDMLEGAGYEVATAESGAVALELLDTARFDAVVSDLRMPDMDGAGLWREVSARHPMLAQRMLFVTGDTLSPDARQFLKASRGLELDKPFSKADLLARVAKLLE
ncbi:MAG: PAS domain S-box protein [Burkholderiales bacterium]|nr:PAS domain S-box protein [Burkholderiales bacterium]